MTPAKGCWRARLKEGERNEGQKKTIAGDLSSQARVPSIRRPCCCARPTTSTRRVGNNSWTSWAQLHGTTNTAMMAVNPFRKNNVVFQKSLCINDFYLANSVRPISAGNVQGLGKLQGGMLTANMKGIRKS